MLAWFAGMVTLVAATYFVCKPQLSVCAEQSERIASAEEKIAEMEDVLDQRDAWEKRLKALSDSVKPLPPDQVAANFLRRTIHDLASAQNVRIRKIDNKEEQKHGGLCVMPVQCQWDNAGIKALVNLLLEFQKNEIIFEVTELLIKSDGKDQLNGDFTVNCVYTKPEGKP